MAVGLILNRNRQVPAEDTPAFAGIAERFRRAGELERAVALCRDGLKKFPDHLSARVTLGWSLLDLGKYDEARVELEKALKRAPDNLAAIRGLAELHERAEHTLNLPMDGPGQWPPDAETIEAIDVAAPPASALAPPASAVAAPAAGSPAQARLKSEPQASAMHAPETGAKSADALGQFELHPGANRSASAPAAAPAEQSHAPAASDSAEMGEEELAALIAAAAAAEAEAEAAERSQRSSRRSSSKKPSKAPARPRVPAGAPAPVVAPVTRAPEPPRVVAEPPPVVAAEPAVASPIAAESLVEAAAAPQPLAESAPVEPLGPRPVAAESSVLEAVAEEIGESVVSSAAAVAGGVEQPVAGQPVTLNAAESPLANTVASESLVEELAAAEAVIAEQVAAGSLVETAAAVESVFEELGATEPQLAEQIIAEFAVAEPVAAESVATAQAVTDPAPTSSAKAAEVVGVGQAESVFGESAPQAEAVVEEAASAEPFFAEAPAAEPFVVEAVAAETFVPDAAAAEPFIVEAGWAEPIAAALAAEPFIAGPVAAEHTGVAPVAEAAGQAQETAASSEALFVGPMAAEVSPPEPFVVGVAGEGSVDPPIPAAGPGLAYSDLVESPEATELDPVVMPAAAIEGQPTPALDLQFGDASISLPDVQFETEPLSLADWLPAELALTQASSDVSPQLGAAVSDPAGEAMLLEVQPDLARELALREAEPELAADAILLSAELALHEETRPVAGAEAAAGHPDSLGLDPEFTFAPARDVQAAAEDRVEVSGAMAHGAVADADHEQPAEDRQADQPAVSGPVFELTAQSIDELLALEQVESDTEWADDPVEFDPGVFLPLQSSVPAVDAFLARQAAEAAAKRARVLRRLETMLGQVRARQTDLMAQSAA